MWWAFVVNFGGGFWLYEFWWTSVMAFGGGSGSGFWFGAWAADFCVGLRWRALGPFCWWTPLVDSRGGLWCWTSLVDLWWWALGWALGAICCWTSVLDVGDEIRGLDCRWSLVLDFEGDFGG